MKKTYKGTQSEPNIGSGPHKDNKSDSKEFLSIINVAKCGQTYSRSAEHDRVDKGGHAHANGPTSDSKAIALSS